jgi:NADP-dependent aldehyde dehydrogenase
VSHAVHHGGPYPSTSDPKFTSVGTAAIYRWMRPIYFQDAPESILLAELKDANPLGIMRLVNGTETRSPLTPGAA